VTKKQWYDSQAPWQPESIGANHAIISQDCLYHHPVHKISFIAQDMTDSRAFGYIFGSPDTGHRFFGIKTDKAAGQVHLVYTETGGYKKI
jgi:hypothetical protein